MKSFVFIAGLCLFCAAAVWAQDAETPQQFEGFNLVGYTDGGTKSWDVTGDTADIMGNDVKITNVVANAYGDENMNLKARTGTVDRESGKIHLEKDVVVTSDAGAKLTTDSLDWEREKDLVTTEDRVHISNDQMHATGIGMTGHPTLKIAQLNEDVRVKVNTAPNPQVAAELDEASSKIITITCDGPMEVDYTKQYAVFNTNVVAIQAGRQITSDRLEVYFNPDTKEIKELICIGNVTIQQGENKSFSERAVLQAKEQKMVLTGRPKLILFTEGENAITSFGD